MTLRTLVAGGIFLFGWSLVSPAATVVVGSHVLSPNQANQTIQVYVTGTEIVGGVNFYAQVGDGGPELADYGLPAGTDGPSITGVDLKTATIFQGVSTEVTDPGSIPQVATRYLFPEAGASVLANGLLATLTLDTTGFQGGTWDLRLKDVLPVLGGYDTDFAPVPIQITNGSILVALPGDANLDGKVTDLDASILAAHWQQLGGAAWADGDFTGDGKVTDLDASILAANWQAGTGTIVPEPTVVALMLGALIAWGLVRCRLASA